MRFVWHEAAWNDYLHWQSNDPRMLKRITVLLREIARGAESDDPHDGIGKPEALKHGLHGYWSRRITSEHRLVYKVVGDEVRIASCRLHYVPE